MNTNQRKKGLMTPRLMVEEARKNGMAVVHLGEGDIRRTGYIVVNPEVPPIKDSWNSRTSPEGEILYYLMLASIVTGQGKDLCYTFTADGEAIIHTIGFLFEDKELALAKAKSFGMVSIFDLSAGSEIDI